MSSMLRRLVSPLLLTVAVAAAVSVASMNRAEAAADPSLKDVMKKMQAQVLNGDTKPLVPMIEATKAKAKPEFSNWNAISDKAKAAAAAGDLDGAKATCKECHDAYRNDYKTKYGSKAP